jgi:hypothetical protein
VQIVCETLSGKYPTQKRDGGTAQVVANKHETLSSKSSTKGENKKKGLGM